MNGDDSSLIAWAITTGKDVSNPKGLTALCLKPAKSIATASGASLKWNAFLGFLASLGKLRTASASFSALNFAAYCTTTTTYLNFASSALQSAAPTDSAQLATNPFGQRGTEAP